MYSSTEDARSDLFLSGAVYLFGPLILGILLSIVPLGGIPLVREALDLTVPFATTALVPLLLIRYRREPWSQYGFGRGQPALMIGLLAALPIVAAAILALVPFQSPAAFIPGPLGLVMRVLRWLGMAFLALYGTVKARDAFSGDPRYLRGAVVEIGRVLGLVAAVAVGLLLLSAVFTPGALPDALRIVALPLGAAVAVAVIHRSLRGPSLTTPPALLAPVILLALGPFRLTFDAVGLIDGIRVAAVFGAIGLIIGALTEARRSAVGAGVLALAVGLLTQL